MAGFYSYPTLNDRGEVLFAGGFSGTTDGSSDALALLLADSSGKLHIVGREGESIDGGTITGFPLVNGNRIISYSDWADAGGTSGFNDNGEVTFYANSSGPGIYGLFLWSQSQIAPPEITGDQVNIPFTMMADSTNYVQAASHLATGQMDFEDISGPIIRPSGRGRIRTNFVDSVTGNPPMRPVPGSNGESRTAVEPARTASNR